MRTSLNEPPDTAITSFRQQASVFSLLNLFVIAALLFVQVLLTQYWGRLSPLLLAALGLGFLFHAVVFMWIQARPAPITRSLVVSLTVSSVAVNSILMFVAAATNHEDSQYFALMIIPILEAAFRFPCSPPRWLWLLLTASISIGSGSIIEFIRHSNSMNTLKRELCP